MKIKVANKIRSLLSLTVQPKIFGLALLIATLFLTGNVRAASPGALDLSFGLRGTSIFTNPNGNGLESRAIFVQADGKVVVAGSIRNCAGPTCTSDFLVVRYNTDGTLDTSFGTLGVVRTDYSGQDETVYDVALQADGKIVVVGGSFGGTPSPTNIYGFKVVRYNADGSLDGTFGMGGRVYESFNDVGGTPQTMAIQPDGKIIVAGTDNNTMLFVARFNTDGGLDTGFGTSGRIVSAAYSTSSTKLALQPDGKIIIAASTNQPANTIKLIRFNTNGTPDTDFGTGGVVNDVFEGGFRPILAVQADGKIIVSGSYGNHDIRRPPLRRYNTNGSVDSSFVPNHGEMIGNACISCTQKPSEILLLPDGRFYLAGYNTRFSTLGQLVAVSRYLPTGSLDHSWGFRGASQFKVTNETTGTTLRSVTDAALQADGKVVITANASAPTFQERIYTVRVTATVTPPSMRGDFDGDRKTDFAVFRPSTRFWHLLRSTDGSIYSERYGADGDVLTPSDYNYDLKTDLSVYRPSQNTWYISASLPTGGGTGGGQFGVASEIKIPEDYDGDGYADLATFSPSTGAWYLRPSSLNREAGLPPVLYEITFQFGLGTDKPVPADYDGDGRADFAVFRPSTGEWYILRSSDGLVTGVNFGVGTDKLVPGDYDGDLRTDIAVYRDGSWYILRSSDNAIAGIGWGIATDKPVPGDYDGDGKYDVAVYRPSEGAWYVLKSSDGGMMAQQWGISEDIPIPFAYLR